MHDFEGVRQMMTRSTLEARLDALFRTNGTTSLPDTTGLIGSYAHGNEPSHHTIFWWFLLGRAEVAEGYLSKVLDTYYTDADDGLIGNDDAGQLSAWYVCAMLGFYPVDPTNASMLHFRARLQRVGRVGLPVPFVDPRRGEGIEWGGALERRTPRAPSRELVPRGPTPARRMTGQPDALG